MGALEMFRPDGSYVRFNEDETIVLARWSNCDKCDNKFEKSLLTTHSELWLCETCR
jgi:hypothetical protein